MKNSVTVYSIEYIGEEVKASDTEETFIKQLGTVATAQAITGDVSIEGTFRFQGVIDSKSEIEKKISELFK